MTDGAGQPRTEDTTVPAIVTEAVCGLRGLADLVSGLRGWRRFATLLFLGGLTALALPPVYGLPVLLITFPVLFWLLNQAESTVGAFAMAWTFAWGFLIAGLYWIANAVLVDAARFGWVWPIALLAFPAALALFYGAAGALTHIICGRDQGGAARLLVFAGAWSFSEWLREFMFTGFPWNQIGQVWSLSDATLQAYSIGGVLPLSYLTVAAATAPALFALRKGAKSISAIICNLLAAGAIVALPLFGFARLAMTPDPGTQPGVRLRLVQPNIPQQLKWRPDLRRQHLDSLIRLSSAKSDKPPSLIIWPETAVPLNLSEDHAGRRYLAAALPPSALLLAGAVRLERSKATASGTDYRIFNSLMVMDSAGRIRGHYDKAHLVPFGEYLPGRQWLGKLGLDKIAAGSRDFSAGVVGQVLTLPNTPAFRPLICYEVIFSKEMTPDKSPAWLLNITNDAWYGNSSGPRQHLQISRIRAVEYGIPMIRVANTGISAVIDAMGRVRASLGMNQQGYLDSDLPRPASTPTFYEIWGNGLFFTMLLASLLAAFMALRRGQRSRQHE